MKNLSFFRGFHKSVKSEKIQLILARDTYYSISYLAIFNLSLNINICEKAQLILAEHYDDNVRWNLSYNPIISEKVQLILVNDRHWAIVKGLASNPGISGRVQLILAEDDLWVKLNLAKNRNISKATQISLAKSYNDSIRYYLRINKGLHEDVRKIIGDR